MSRRRLAIAFGVTACLTLQVGSAHAQASSCVKVLLEYVGKPLAEAFAEKGAGLAAEYFVAKVKQSQQSAVPTQAPTSSPSGTLRNCGISMRRMARASASCNRTYNKPWFRPTILPTRFLSCPAFPSA